MPFILEVEFSGLCLFVRRQDNPMKVFLPDARLTRGPRVHLDGTPAVPHVAYVRFNMADLPNDHRQVKAVVNDRAPDFEIVRRLNREAISFGLSDAPVDSTGLDVPDFSVFAGKLEVDPALFAPAPPKIVASTELGGGTIESFSVAGQTWSLSAEHSLNGGVPEAEYGGMVVWTSGEIPGDELVLTLTPFDPARPPVQIPLFPRAVAGGLPRIAIKIGNLCKDNPLEWDELPQPTVTAPDVDFKWLYTLLQPRPAGAPGFPAVLPHPQPVATSTEGMLQDCLPAVIDE